MLGRPGRLMGSPAVAKGWSALDHVLAWWDSSVGITKTGNAVTGWRDRKSDIEVLRAGADTSPTHQDTSFNGAPGVLFDGVANRLSIAALPGIIPIGANPVWAYFVVQQDSLPADAATRHMLSYGGSGAAVARYFRRVVTGGSNRAQATVGSGGASTSVSYVSGLFEGRQLAIMKVGATATSVSLNGAAPASSAVVPATGGTNGLVIGANHTSAGFFFKGIIRDIVLTAPLSAENEANLQAFLMARRML